MRPVLLSLFLLGFSLSIATALKCYKCLKKNSDTCDQEVQECPEGEQCMTVSEAYIINGTFHSIQKGCSGDMPCDQELYFTNNDFHYKTSIKCCDTDLCNDRFYEMPEDEKPDGSICPSCLALNTLEECEKDSEVICPEKDDKCMRFAGDVERPDDVTIRYTAKGCMSALACVRLGDVLTGAKLLNVNVFECKNPSSKE